MAHTVWLQAAACTYSIFWAFVGSSFSARMRSTIFESIPGMFEIEPDGFELLTTVLFIVLFTLRLTV